jgi:Papain family cysteine protease/Cathepsin propeptide inhibitor domain (I29)
MCRQSMQRDRIQAPWFYILFGLTIFLFVFVVLQINHKESELNSQGVPMISVSESIADSETFIFAPVTTNATEESSMLGFIKPERIAIQRELIDLRHEFDEWIILHDKKYGSKEEKEHRFNIWKENHYKSEEKNDRHGPCKMTNKLVFGSNIFKDLTQDEFQSKFLTGYKGPKSDYIYNRRTKEENELRPVLDPRNGPYANIHLPRNQEKEFKKSESHGSGDGKRMLGFSASYSASCTWYDVSCWLRLFVSKYGYRVGGTMEPRYDANVYPSAVDWREKGVVTSIHSQGNCGACWAITAVETIESAYAIHTGTLYDLSETEVIICDESCDLCEGGWPQNAYEYAMKHNGLPLEKTMSYNGDYLLELTYSKGSESSSYYKSAIQNLCPADDKQGSNRYGSIGGYGYSTDRCICYSDGTGCNCEKQNEKLALQNIAAYGPATVCVDASLWQDYTGGIITSDLGCGSAFLDMNHCVQAVGYAYTDSSNQNEKNSHSRDGSRDNKGREGYWIIRNQWSEYWGMNGYAFVAMGANTCGVLNDMTNVFMKN